MRKQELYLSIGHHEELRSDLCEIDRGLEPANKMSIHGLELCHRATVGLACWML